MFRYKDEAELFALARRGRRIQEILEDEDFRLVVENLMREYHSQWEGSPTMASDVREQCYLQLRAVQELLRALRRTVDVGEAAQKEIERRANE